MGDGKPSVIRFLCSLFRSAGHVVMLFAPDVMYVRIAMASADDAGSMGDAYAEFMCGSDNVVTVRAHRDVTSPGTTAVHSHVRRAPVAVRVWSEAEAFAAIRKTIEAATRENVRDSAEWLCWANEGRKCPGHDYEDELAATMQMSRLA